MRNATFESFQLRQRQALYSNCWQVLITPLRKKLLFQSTAFVFYVWLEPNFFHKVVVLTQLYTICKITDNLDD